MLPPFDHANEYGAVPPTGFAVAVPFASPHVESVADAVHVGDELDPTEALHSVVHPAASVTVTL